MYPFLSRSARLLCYAKVNIRGMPITGEIQNGRKGI